jgi:hypothetical protein
VSHSLFPKSVWIEEFITDMEAKLIPDSDINSEYIKDLANKIIINHEIEHKKKLTVQNILNGVNIFIIERDCNNFYDIECSCSDKKDSIVIMKEGGLYKPVLKIEDNGIRGLFKRNDNIIEYLVENGSQM